MHTDYLHAMTYNPGQAREALSRFMDIHSLSARSLCAAADLSPSALSQFLQGRVHSLKSSTYEALAVGAGKLVGRSVSTAELRGEVPSQPASNAKLHSLRQPPASVTVPLRGEMDRDLPILGSVSGGPGGLWQMENGSAVDWARRPPRLIGRTDVFGLFVEETSMIPAHMPGSLVIVEKARPPKPGDDVVFELLPDKPHGERKAMIKRLVALTPTLVKVEQFQPPKRLEFARKLVVNLYRVMTIADLFGM